MSSVLNAIAVYMILLICFRVAGKRTLAQLNPFDFVLLLIISEATQQALLGDDYSVTTSALVVVTLVLSDLCLARIKRRFGRLDRCLEGEPIVLVKNGGHLES